MKTLGIITKNNSFDQLVAELKKRNISVNKASVKDDLRRFDSLIIDLAYPLDMAYTTLEDLYSNPDFSDKVILVSISHRSQLTKLRTFSFAVDGYISPQIDAGKLLCKIKEASDPEKFLPRKSLEGKSCEIIIDGLLTHISESGAIIKSKAAFLQGDDIKISSPLFSELKIDKRVISKISKSNPLAKKNFISQLDFLNLSDLDRDKIRKMIFNWNVE